MKKDNNIILMGSYFFREMKLPYKKLEVEWKYYYFHWNIIR